MKNKQKQLPCFETSASFVIQQNYSPEYLRLGNLFPCKSSRPSWKNPEQLSLGSNATEQEIALEITWGSVSIRRQTV